MPTPDRTAGRLALIAAVAALGPTLPASAQVEVSEQEASADAARTERHAESMAEMPDEAARSHFRIGRTLYEEGRFRQAAAEFHEAYRLSERSELLFNVYLAYRDAGLLEQASDALRRFLSKVETVQGREALEGRLQAMEETIAERQTRAREQQREAAREATEQTEQRERARAERQIEQAREHAAQQQRQRSLIPWIAGGIGIVKLAAGTVTGVLAARDIQDLEDDCPDRQCSPAVDLDGRRDSIQRLTRTTDALLFGGLAVLGTGVLLFVLDVGVTDEPAANAGAACDPRGCAAELQVRF